MKKMFMLLSLSITATAVMPSVGSAKLVLDLPPILVGKTSPSNTCTTSADCTSGTYGSNCCGGACQQAACPNTCTTSADCTGGTYGPNCCGGACQQAACPNTCTTSADCTGSSYGPNCCNGACQQTACPSGCTVNSDCGAGYCCSGTCQTTACPTACTVNSDCGAGYCCSGTCQATACPTGCTTDANCGTGQFCCDSTCQAEICVPATAGLNDTGIIPPTISTSGQEDADFGRDKTANNNADGHAGFSFTKLSSNGAVLAANATSWACVEDKVTKLIWENKAAPTKLPWYNSNSATNGGNAGNANGNSNTQTYAEKANADSLCGKSTGWRVPTIKELVSLINSSKTGMAADQSYFQGINTSNTFFWSATPSAIEPLYAWGVNFNLGHADNQFAKENTDVQSIMLVRTAD